jgi:hypothetical protein
MQFGVKELEVDRDVAAIDGPQQQPFLLRRLAPNEANPVQRRIDAMSPALRKAATILGVLAALFAAFLGWAQWTVHKVHVFCGEVHAGMPVSSLPDLAVKHGINPMWAKGGYRGQGDPDWLLAVPAEGTMGDTVCAIHHDQKVVVSARMMGE